MSFTKLLVATLAALLIAGLAADLVAQDQGIERRARVSARPLEDGRIEFAFQLEADAVDLMEEEGTAPPTNWDERNLPRGRNFPADVATDRWLSSNPSILVGEVETRIRARRLEDGRTEFALQQKTDGENWGENILPSGRYLSASHRISHIDRWLNSSVVTLSTVIVIPPVVVPAGVPIVAEAVLARAELDGWTYNGSEPSFYYGVQQDPLDDTYFTWIVKVAHTDDDLYDTMRIEVSCRAGSFEVVLWENELPYQPSDRRVRVSYRFDSNDAITESWNHYSGNEDSFYPPDASEFADKMQSANRLVIRANFFSQTLTATFTGVNQMFRTRVQPNIEYCGHY